MHPHVLSLLALQSDDLAIYALEDRMASLEPRLAALEKERSAVSSQLDRVRTDTLSEETRHREALSRLETHTALVERSQRAYESVTSPKEANAAVIQLEQTKRMASESEREVGQIVDRISTLRHQASELETSVSDVEERQSQARSEIAAEKSRIQTEMDAAMSKRKQSEQSVMKNLLTRYDRVRKRKREESVFPLRGTSCSACNTSIPTQRRSAMFSLGAVELCEGCGVLLYAAE